MDEYKNFNNENRNINNEPVGEERIDLIQDIVDCSKTDGVYSDFINIETQNTKKKKHGGRKAAAVIGAVVLCGASVGFGIGAGLNTSNSIISSSNLNSFKFDNNKTSANITNADYLSDKTDSKIVLTNSSINVPEIIKGVKDSVVNISIKTRQASFFNQVLEATGSGSGIIYKEDDEKVYIVTNNHVVDNADSVSISITGDEQVKASLVGKDAQSDLAVISVLKSDLKAAGIESVNIAKFADSSNIEVGEYVLAIGNALGEGKTVTQGIISAQNKEVNIDGKKLTVLQTDAAINPGNSGGALVNSNGEVIGINTAKLSSSAIEGMGYAIPTSVAKGIIDELMENGSIERPYFGIMGFTITKNFQLTYNIDANGVFVSEVEGGSNADAAGLKSTDIITGFNGNTITTVEELSAAISGCKVGDNVNIDIIRNGTEKMTLNVTLNKLNQNF